MNRFRKALLLLSLQSCPTLCDPIDGSPPDSPFPGILQARTRVGCHFLLQCMKVKSESEVAQWCPTLSDPMDCSPPGSSVHGIFQARVLEWGAIAFSGGKLYIHSGSSRGNEHNSASTEEEDPGRGGHSSASPTMPGLGGV